MSGHEVGTDSPRFSSLAELLDWCRSAPSGTRLDASELAHLLEELEDRPETEGEDEGLEGRPERLSWPARLWTLPAETRIGVPEVAECLERPESFVYRHTKEEAENPIPHAKLEGRLRFRIGEVRTWLRETEEVEEALPMTSTAAERRRLSVVSDGEGAA